MVEVVARKSPINQNIPWVDKNGMLTTEAYRVMRAISDVVSEIAIADGEISTQLLAENAVTADKIADNASTTVKLADESVTEAKIAPDAVTTPKLADGAVSTIKINDAAVTMAKIAPNAVTAVVSSTGADITVTLADGETEIHTEDILVEDGDVAVWFSAKATSTDLLTPLTTYKLKIDGAAVQTKEWNVGPSVGARDVFFYYVSVPSVGNHTYSVTADLGAATSILHEYIQIRLRNYKR